MGKRNNMVPNRHFHKDWQRYVKVWFNQPAKKVKRHDIRQKKALRIAPRPLKGPLRPVVQCPSFRYNSKCRLGRGFSLQEIKAAKININFARTIGIAIDHRRKNKSYESLQKNKQRLQEYMNKLILFPKHDKKFKEYESSKEECKKATQLEGIIMPVPLVKKRTKCLKLEVFKDAPSVYETLQEARRSIKTKKSRRVKFGETEDKN